MILNTILAPTTNGPEISQSAWSRAYGPPQVAGILTSVAFSPNGKVLAAGASGGQRPGSRAQGVTYLLNVSSGKQFQKLRPGGGAEAFNPDGTMLATAGGPNNSATYLWNANTGGWIANLPDPHGSGIESVSFSPNGNLLAANDKNGSVYVWQLPRGTRTTNVSPPVSVSPPGGPNTDAVAFSPRGTTLAMGGSDGQVYLFNTASNSPRGSLSTTDSSGVTSVAFSRGGALLAAGEMDGVINVWNLDHGGSLISLDNPDRTTIESVAFSPNGKWLATGDADGNTDLWNLAANKNKPAETLANPKGPGSSPARNAVYSVAFDPDGHTLATTDTNGHIYLWPMP